MTRTWATSPNADIPALKVDGVPVRVMLGSAWGVTSPVRQFAQTLYVEARLQPGEVLQLPPASERALYVVSGQERIEQAKDDWRAGRFPKVPGDEEEFIPLP